MNFDTQWYLESASLEEFPLAGQVVGVSNREVKEVAGRHHTFLYKSQIFDLTKLGV